MLQDLQEHPLLSHARQRAWDLQSRLVWAPGLANGAAIVAVAGLVGNVDHPDTALAALWPALSLFAGGLIASAVSAVCLAHHARELVRRADVADKISQAGVAGATIQDGVIEKIKTLQLNAKVNPEAFSQGMAEIMQTMAAHSAGLPLLQDLKRRVEGLPIKEPRTEHAAYGLTAAALAFCLLGFASVVVGHLAGTLRLEPAAQSPGAPSAAPTVQSVPKPAPPKSAGLPFPAAAVAPVSRR